MYLYTYIFCKRRPTTGEWWVGDGDRAYTTAEYRRFGGQSAQTDSL